MSRKFGNDQVLEILVPIWSTKTETATRLRGRLESILDWAEHRGYRSGENPASWNGNLKHELPSAAKLKKRKKRHHPALPYTRIAAFMADLRSRQRLSRRGGVRPERNRRTRLGAQVERRSGGSYLRCELPVKRAALIEQWAQFCEGVARFPGTNATRPNRATKAQWRRHVVSQQ
jgi:hypothetical protein